MLQVIITSCCDTSSGKGTLALRTYVSVSISDIRAHYGSGAGRHWFDRGTMRFFKTKLPRVAYANNTREVAFFVTRETGPEMPSRYSVRKYDFRTRNIETVGDFNSWVSREDATANAKALAEFNQVLP